MIWAIEPLVILFLAGWFLRERIGPSLVVLSLVAIGGLLLVIGQPDGSGSLLGVLLTIAGVGCCATYTSSPALAGHRLLDHPGHRRPAGIRHRVRPGPRRGRLDAWWGSLA